VDLDSYRRPAITEPRIVALTAVTRVIDDPAIEPTAIEPARVRVTLKNGEALEARSDTIKGSPQEPMSAEERLAKLRDCLACGLEAAPAQADRLADAVEHLEQAEDAVASLLAAFPGR
jgi:hypothetical protein